MIKRALTQFSSIVAVLALTLASGAHAEEPAIGGMEYGGQIQELDFSESTLMVNGIVFDVRQDVDVQINGTYGAFTMLKPGMKIRYAFTLPQEGRGLIHIIREDDSIPLF